MRFSRLIGCRAALCCGAAVAVLLLASTAEAQQRLTAINIPAKPLASALTELAQETGVNVLFSPEAVRGLQSAPVNAKVLPETAARRLLVGTRLDVLRDPAGALIVRERAGGDASADLAQATAAAAQASEDAAASPASQPPAGGDEPSVEQQARKGESASREVAPSPLAGVGLAEVIVTAQKRAESLQDTPISIAVLGGEALENRGVATITDMIAGAVPSLRITPSSGRTSVSMIGMRGIVPSDVEQISRDATVGIYVDGVYLGRVHGLGTELFDVERVEVLRGPQGTLFGRNAVGGALSIITRKPSGELGGKLQAGVGNFSGYNVKGSLDLPQVAGVSVKVDGNWSKRDGWIDNPLEGQWDFAQSERYGVRLAALWEPSEALDVQYAFEKSRNESGNNYPHILDMLPGASPLAPIFSVDSGRVDHARMGVLLEPSVTDVEGHGLHITWDLSDDLALRSITSYREMDQSLFHNYAGTYYGYRPNGSLARATLIDVGQHQFSQELQLVGSSERVKYVLGAFYFDEQAEDSSFGTATARFDATGTAYTIIPVPANRVSDRDTTAHAESLALFGQATWTPPLLGDRLHLTGGLRWTNDQKDGRVLSVRGVPSPLKFDFESKRIDPAATIAFDWTDDINTYLRWGTAYRAGGANSRSVTFRTFAEEEVETWEVGLKADLFNRRARLNVALYRTDYRDRQLDYSSPANPAATETINSDDDATIKGLELDLSVRPLPGLTLSAGYAYTDGDMPPNVNPFSGAVTAVNLLLTPNHAGTLAADYELERFGFGALSLHLDANYSGGFYAYSVDPNESASYVLVNGRLTLGRIRMGGDGSELSVSLWGKNLTDEEYEIFDFNFAGTGLSNGHLGFFNEPRTYGAEIAFRF